MHPSLVALLKKKYVYEDVIKGLIAKHELSEEDMAEFYETYSWNIRSFDSDDDNNIKLFLQDISRYPNLSSEEERELIKKFMHWDSAAKERLIIHMAGYVVSIAKKFVGVGISLLDLVSEWILWLEKAVMEFDPTKADRLSTYANAWINAYMLSALAKYNNVTSLPLHTINELKFIDGIEQKLFQTIGRQPTQDEIIVAVQEANHFKRTISAERVAKLLLIKQWSLYLWRPLDEDSRDNMWDTIIDKMTLTPLEESQKKYMRHNILALVESIMTPRDANIIKMRFGIDWPICTLEQIGQSLGVTRERVRQIEKKFIVKVRTHPQLNVFLSI